MFDSSVDLKSFDSQDSTLDSFDTSHNSLSTELEQVQRIRSELDQMSHLTWYSYNVKTSYQPPERTENQHDKVKVSKTSYAFTDIMHVQSTSARFIHQKDSGCQK